MERYICERRCNEGLRSFKRGLCGTIRTINAEGDKRVIIKHERTTSEDQKYIDNISNKYSFAKKRTQEMLDENGKLPQMFNPYNKSEIKDNAPTLTTSCDRSCASSTVLIKAEDYAIRRLTPRECWRLMDFSDSDFDKAKAVGMSDTQLYKQAGNSICVGVLYYIYKNLYSAMPYLFENLKVSSFFSGIGAFEIALDRLYDGINSGNFTSQGM